MDLQERFWKPWSQQWRRGGMAKGRAGAFSRLGGPLALPPEIFFEILNAKSCDFLHILS